MNVSANYQIITVLKIIFLFKKPLTFDIDSEARLKKSYSKKNKNVRFYDLNHMI